ncbi:MAG: ATP-binding protein [Bernardetiaceae bacterium]|nr:ATP-binding protein [Bernardetiaceae bacterium]
MNINSLSFVDTDTKWNLSKVEFKSLTLLVGASGVGKTQILESILKLRAIVKGKSISGTRWEIDFTTLDGSNYVWKGEFEQTGKSILRIKSDNDKEEDDNNPKINHEELYLNDKKIIDRDTNKIIFDGQKTVKLAQDKSVMNLLKEEDLISPAFQGFQRIIFSDQVESKRRPQRFNPDFITKERILQKYKTIESIRESDENIITKLYLAYHNAEDIIHSITERFIDIFPFVTEIKIAPLEFEDGDNTPSLLREIPFIQIKEKNVEDWVIQPHISSGMYRTLMHLSELYLCSEGSIILIDEFENSLGVNCIDELTVDLQNSSHRNLQFIITSHHPYIINQVNFKNWKLVTRKGSQVVTREANDLIDFNKSKQKAFIQLTQLEEFTTGITE